MPVPGTLGQCLWAVRDGMPEPAPSSTRERISYAARRARRGEAAPAGASPFLRELGPVLAAGSVPRPRRTDQRQLRLL